MNPILWWSLLISAVVVVSGGLFFFVYSVIKVRKIKRKILLEASKLHTEKEQKGIETVLNNNKHGELLWDFRDKERKNGVRLISEIILEFTINVIIRNQYKSIVIDGDTNGFTAINIKKRWPDCNVYITSNSNSGKVLKNAKEYNVEIKLSPPTNDIDLVLLQNDKKDVNKKFTKFIAELKNDGMMIVDESKPKNKIEKKAVTELIKKLRFSNLRHEVVKFAENVLLIVK